jgi:LuxR family transcriptional regulator, regulator of acetate metabolism
MTESPIYPNLPGPVRGGRTTTTGRHLAVALPPADSPTAPDPNRAGSDRPTPPPPRHELADEVAREIYQEALSIARSITDRSLRTRLDVLCDRLAPPPEPDLIDVPRLTTRELQVLGEIALGHTNLEVAEHLSIMPTTVKTYLKNTMRKFGTRNRVETILAARRAGLLRG